MRKVIDALQGRAIPREYKILRKYYLAFAIKENIYNQEKATYLRTS